MLHIWRREETIFGFVNSGSAMRRSFIFPSLKGLQNDLSLSRFRRVDDAIFYSADAEGVKKQSFIFPILGRLQEDISFGRFWTGSEQIFYLANPGGGSRRPSTLMLSGRSLDSFIPLILRGSWGDLFFCRSLRGNKTTFNCDDHRRNKNQTSLFMDGFGWFFKFNRL